MVFLTMTAGVVAAVERFNHIRCVEDDADGGILLRKEEPSLDQPHIGSPISHGQLIELSKLLQKHGGRSSYSSYSLETLLKGCTIYTPAPKPKAEQTSEYKELMARLRRDEEQRSYQRMVSQPSASSQANPFTIKSPALDQYQSTSEEDEMTYADVNRQVTLIINILVTVVACSIAIWLIARHWSAPQRLALSMGGSGLIGVAEVVIYSGYIRRLNEAKKTEKMNIEKKVITDTWVIERKAKRE